MNKKLQKKLETDKAIDEWTLDFMAGKMSFEKARYGMQFFYACYRELEKEVELLKAQDKVFEMKLELQKRKNEPLHKVFDDNVAMELSKKCKN